VEVCLGLLSCIVEFEVFTFLKAQYKIQNGVLHSRTEIPHTLP
jgi:hypothetical protein